MAPLVPEALPTLQMTLAYRSTNSSTLIEKLLIPEAPSMRIPSTNYLYLLVMIKFFKFIEG